jgi:serine acetyltransferase
MLLLRGVITQVELLTSPAPPRGETMFSRVRALVRQVREDLEAHGGDWMRPGLHALAVHRFGNWRMGVEPQLLRAPLSVSYRVMERFCRTAYGIELPYSAQIGRRVVVEHQNCIVIHGRAVIGDECIIRHGVTIGARSTKDHDRAPVLGRGVDIGAGAKILGAITIGDRVAIGANAVVLVDVPSDALAVGVPARVIERDSRAGARRKRTIKAVP